MQEPELLIDYYNRIITWLAQVSSHESLQLLSWPVPEFSGICYLTDSLLSATVMLNMIVECFIFIGCFIFTARSLSLVNEFRLLFRSQSFKTEISPRVKTQEVQAQGQIGATA